jgi:hypothetical protein
VSDSAAARDSIPLRCRSRFHSATLPLAIPFRYAAARDSIPLRCRYAAARDSIPLRCRYAAARDSIPLRCRYAAATLPLRCRSRFHSIPFHSIPFHSISNACIHTLYSPALRYFRNSPETINLQEFVRVYETSLPSSIAAEGLDVVA